MRDGHPDEPLYVALSYFRGLFDYLRSRGADLAPVLERIGVHDDELADSDLHLPGAALTDAFAAAEELTGDPHIGLRAGQAMQLNHLGILGHLLVACRRIEHLFDLHVRYQRLLSNAAEPEYRVVGDQVCLDLRRAASPALNTPHVINYFLSGWVHMARLLAGADFRPDRVEVTSPEPTDASVAVEIFRCPMSFAQAQTRIYFSWSYLERSLFQGDPELRRALEAEARRRLQALGNGDVGASARAPTAPERDEAERLDDDPRIRAIRREAAALFVRGVPEIGDVARAIGTSVRSLQRLLAGAGTTYKQLIDRLRQQLALRYVRDESLALVDVALMLGFSDQTAFQRAFRRWFDATPGAMRRGSHGA